MKIIFLAIILVQIKAFAGPLQAYISASPESFCAESLTHIKEWSCLYHSEVEKKQLLLEKAKFCAQHSKIEVISDYSDDFSLKGEVKIIGSFSSSEPSQTCTVHYSFTEYETGPSIDRTYTTCEFLPKCNEKSQKFACLSEASKTTIMFTPQKLYFLDPGDFLPAGLINDKSPALPYAINQSSVFYSWEEPSLESSSTFDIQRTLFINGQGQINQYWTYGCFGEMCPGYIEKGIKNWQCSRIK